MQSKNVTIHELNDHLKKEVNNDIDYLMTSSLVKFLVLIGAAKAVGKKSADGGRGKPSIIYEIDNEFDIVLWEDKASEIIENQANTSEVAPENTPPINAPVEIVA